MEAFLAAYKPLLLVLVLLYISGVEPRLTLAFGEITISAGGGLNISHIDLHAIFSYKN